MFKQQYMTLESSDDMDEEIPSKEREKSSSQRVVIKGWRTIKSEVFIPPKNRGVLACLVGNGAHLIMIVNHHNSMITLTILDAGRLSNRTLRGLRRHGRQLHPHRRPLLRSLNVHQWSHRQPRLQIAGRQRVQRFNVH